ncbi:MAG: right-handed parallel beta-helix repeat-containing protein, partial [Planctomycetes bacterium]|nr:right-handed parallel beta-helix repeat-containing protein [Planctomycetota bacterium]
STLEFEPTRLCFDGLQYEQARMPESGWMTAQNVGEGVLIANDLKQQPFDIFNTKAFVWTKHGNQFHTLNVKSLNAESGQLDLHITSKWQKFTAGDKFYLQNNPAFIRKAGIWSYVKKSDTSYELYVWPRTQEELPLLTVPQPKVTSIIAGIGVHHFTLAGIDVVGSFKDGIYMGYKSSHVDVRYCRAYENTRYGINFRDVSDSKIRNNIAALNYNSGISLHTTNNITIEHNEVGLNFIDGILVTWGSRDIQVARNYVHHHLFWGHPDNMQMYRDVAKVSFTDNFLFTSGQGLMCEQANDCTFRGNLCVGTVANTLILGHQDTSRWEVSHNTFAYTGYSCMSLTAEDYDVHHNIFVTGQPSVFFSTKGVKGYRGAQNIFWHGKGLEGAIIGSDTGWHNSLADFQKADNTDAGSMVADPQFKNAPQYFSVIDTSALAECRRDTLVVRSKSFPVEIGDFIEINFDGIKRSVTAVDKRKISYTPALVERPLKSWLVANWQKNDNFVLDFSLSEKSPAMNADKQQQGSQVHAQNYINGDFDGDGQRDLPDALQQMEMSLKKYK